MYFVYFYGIYKNEHIIVEHTLLCCLYTNLYYPPHTIMHLIPINIILFPLVLLFNYYYLIIIIC
jgi:hypothetical protein